MAYAALTSLYHTINHLLNSSCISVASSTQEILRSAQLVAQCLQRTLERYDEIKSSGEEVMAVDARIREEARKLEDAIESQASAQFLSQSQNRHGTLSLNLHHLRHDIDCFDKTAKKMEAEYMEELHKPAPHQEAATSDSGGNDMVGLSDYFLKIRDFIVVDQASIAITGMAGIGKTAFVKKLFNDSLVKEKFECRAFVRVGQKYQFEDILRAIIAQLNVEMIMEGDEHIEEYFKRCLRGRKHVIVLDDVWDENFINKFAPFVSETCVVVTSRIQEIFYGSYQMPFLNEEESWELLRRDVFGEEECPPLLVKAGKKIAQNCEGLPLLILTVAKHLSEVQKDLEYWEEVAEMQNSVFEDACDQIYEVLISSYHYMAQNAKACFLYMGVFPKNYVVGRSRIINLWRAERFAEGVMSLILDYLTSSNLVVIRQQSLSSFDKAKACNLHVVYRHVSKREGENNKFLHILNRYADDLIQRIKDMRHLAIHHNTLLAIKEVHHSIESVSTLRSVLCTGPYHQYQVPIICLELKLLRVLDALTIRFYEFPVEVVELIQLRYLSLTTNANLPPSINKLWFLQFLILHQHLSINRGIVKTYVPVEIWNLQELEHLQIKGRNLPHPPPGTILPNLKELLDVGVQTCAKGVLDSIPMLEKLRIQIEWAPDAAQTTSCFDHIFCLEKLRSLGSVVKNPTLLPKPTVPPRFLSIFVCGLEKLSLSGFGYPWEDMSKIAQLPSLQALKLRSYAFRGEKWEAKKMRFWSLRHLLIEDTDIVQWTAAHETFPSLSYITMINCHKLREIPLLEAFLKIELVDCNPLAETCAKQDVRYVVEANYSWK